MVHYYKIDACGNDFILLEERPHRKLIMELCDRTQGIGADGVMVYLPGEEGLVFEHYDPDGSFSYCLNGTRASISCLFKQKKIPERGIVSLGKDKVPYQMRDTPCLFLEKRWPSLKKVETSKGTVDGYFVDVGNPHFVLVSKDLDLYRSIANEIRHQGIFPNGANVHLMRESGAWWDIFSYERGVEDFTLSCGSGTLAAACVVFGIFNMEQIVFNPEGNGKITCEAHGPLISLKGPVSCTTEGEWT